MPTASDLIALPILLVAALAGALISRLGNRRSWPKALITLPLVLLGWAGMVREGMIDNFVRWLSPAWSWPLATIAFASLLLGLILFLQKVPKIVAAWISLSAAFVATFTLTNARGGRGRELVVASKPPSASFRSHSEK
ncbi:hypothetical protein IDVR_03920 [Intrasporangium sp. DVR]